MQPENLGFFSGIAREGVCPGHALRVVITVAGTAGEDLARRLYRANCCGNIGLARRQTTDLTWAPARRHSRPAAGGLGASSPVGRWPRELLDKPKADAKHVRDRRLGVKQTCQEDGSVRSGGNRSRAAWRGRKNRYAHLLLEPSRRFRYKALNRTLSRRTPVQTPHQVHVHPSRRMRRG